MCLLMKTKLLRMTAGSDLMDNFELWYRYHKDKGDMPAGVSKYLNYKYGVKKHAGTISGYDQT